MRCIRQARRAPSLVYQLGLIPRGLHKGAGGVGKGEESRLVCFRGVWGGNLRASALTNAGGFPGLGVMGAKCVVFGFRSVGLTCFLFVSCAFTFTIVLLFWNNTHFLEIVTRTSHWRLSDVIFLHIHIRSISLHEAISVYFLLPTSHLEHTTHQLSFS